MRRSMMQVHVKGSNEAVEFYQKAFDAELIASHLNSDGTFYHSELDVYGQILAVSEAANGEVPTTGTTMQFCLQFGKGNEDVLQKAYDVLKDGADIRVPLGLCDYSPLMASLVDKFGVWWCLFI